MRYREEKLVTARAATARLADDPLMDAIYLAGSLPAGLGSPTSDVDVFAVVSSDTDIQVRQITEGGERLDVETYTLDWFRDAFAKVEQWAVSRQDLRSTGLTRNELDVLLRMRQMEVVKDSPNLADLRSRLAHNEDRLRQMTLNHWALEANGHLSDFKGSCEDEDFTTAALVGQTLMLCAGKSLTTAAGDPYYGTKWVHRQLERSVSKDFPHSLYTSLQTGSWADGDPREGMREFLSFLQTLSVASQLLGWDAPEVNRWPFWVTGPGPLRRNPQYNVIHLTEGVLLNNELRRQFVVKPDVALVWGLCNGREPEEVVEAAVPLHKPLSAGTDEAPLTAGRAHEIVQVLLRRGLASRELFR
ncbi:hypothetical protein [Streptomyces poriferorum]|uniref:Polymerase nucleotidyl transferase domain-containing protein n=1 Tax=Streptomyces poriferorum TaxID=2798799 RepID=A0ABY9IFZ8_9ACTN|nr:MULTISPECIES: hypothetical protein [unclassified Streptomyces]MDP5315767.1 hypothetical protein [Streptomyces sp. Alt4]WLQ54127.1 hypothetical protein P8A19_01100 [Streptomyces sp. Alt2]